MAQSRLRALGRFTLELEQVPAPSIATQKARALLACLVVHYGADVSRERLIEVFWPDADPDRARVLPRLQLSGSRFRTN